MKKPGLSRDHYLEMLQKTPHRYQMYLFALALNRRGGKGVMGSLLRRLERMR